MDISALEAKSKKREDLLLSKEKQPLFKEEAALVYKPEGAKVQKRKRTGNKEKKKIVSQLQVQVKFLDPYPFHLLQKKVYQMREIWCLF